MFWSDRTGVVQPFEATSHGCFTFHDVVGQLIVPHSGSRSMKTSESTCPFFFSLHCRSGYQTPRWYSVVQEFTQGINSKGPRWRVETLPESCQYRKWGKSVFLWTLVVLNFQIFFLHISTFSEVELRPNFQFRRLPPVHLSLEDKGLHLHWHDESGGPRSW